MYGENKVEIKISMVLCSGEWLGGLSFSRKACPLSDWSARSVKALAKEHTLLRTHYCRHRCFPVCPRANICCGQKFCVRDTKNVSDFVQKHFVSATNVSQFAQLKKHHGQQCVRNNVSSFTRALTVNCFPFDVMVFAMLPAHGIWRETVSLLDVIWPWTSQWMGAL